MEISNNEEALDTRKSFPKVFNSQPDETLSYRSPRYVTYIPDFKTGKHFFINNSIKHLTGYDSGEINQAGFKNLIKEIVSNNDERYKIEGSKNSYIEEQYTEYLIETKDGEQKWIEDTSFIYLDDEGKTVSSLGILRDISSIQLFLDSLNDEKNNLKKIFDLSATILLQLDMNLNINMINKKGCEIFGGKKQEIIGKNLADFVPQNDRKEFNRYIKGLLIQKDFETKSNEGKIISLSGDVKYIEWQNTILRDKQDRLISIVASGHEITNKKQEDKIRSIIAEILNEANSEKNIDGLFKFIHKSISKLMTADNFYISYYDSETNQLSFPYFVDKYEDEALPMELGRGLTSYVFRKGKSFLLNQAQTEDLVRRGITDVVGEMPKIWLGVPLKIKNKIIGVLVVQDYHDTSAYTLKEQQILDVIAYPISRAIERKIVETEREKMIAQLKELNMSKDQLFSLISHDLRNPFNSLLGFAEIITNEYDSLTRDEVMEYLNVINVSAKNLFGMTNKLLQYSRYQLGKYGYFPNNLDILEVLETSLEKQKYNIQNKKIYIEKNIDENTSIWADEELVTLILANIIENAVKYSNPEGRISITAKADENNSNILIIIKDEGTGISVVDLKRIESKELLSTPGTMKESGAGIGLILSRDFIEMNFGELKIESKEGYGTTISIILPSKQQV